MALREGNWGMTGSPLDDVDAGGQVDGAPLHDQSLQLRLHHLFVLTAVMAGLLAINGPHRGYATAKYQPPPLLRTAELVVGITHTILSAAALTALGYGIAWYRRGLRFFNQPGHWLLIELSFTTLIGIVPSSAYRLMASAGDSERMTFGDARMLLSFALMGYMLLFIVLGRMVLNIYIGRKKISDRWWKHVFYAKAVGTVLFGLGSVLVLLYVLRAMRTDRQQRIARSASHRYGVALQLALCGLTLLGTGMGIFTMYTLMRR